MCRGRVAERRQIVTALERRDEAPAAGLVGQLAVALLDRSRTMASEDYRAKIEELVKAMDDAEGKAAQDPPKGQHAGTHVIRTGRKPLSMYLPELWQKAFPDLFPYPC